MSPIAPALLLLLAATTIAAASFHGSSDDLDGVASCVYTMFVRTGSILKGGTDSNVSVVLYDKSGSGLRIGNLELWGGAMPSGWNYFERSNLDIFTGRGPCLDAAPCELVLTSDGSGDHHGWYVNYVEVTVTGPHRGCAQTLFTVERWLATDVSPYELEATVDNCGGDSSRRRRRRDAADA